MVKLIRTGPREDGRWNFAMTSIAILIALVIVYPFVNVLAVSFSSSAEVYKDPMMIWPHGFTLNAYHDLLKNNLIWMGYKNTIITTTAGTVLSLVLSVLLSYPLSRKDFRGKKIVSAILIFTMLFNGGLIPNFLLIKKLHLYNTIWALILPGAVSAYNCILIRSFFQSIPDSLTECAELDGASDLQILLNIILPLSKPILATITLFTAVGKWNSFFSAIVYTKSRELWTLQLVLREMLIAVKQQSQDILDASQMVASKSMDYAAIVVATVPILCIYPFVQKYFISGMMLGAVKE